MEKVRIVVVQSPEEEIRTAARKAYAQFLLVCLPNGGNAVKNHLEFLKANLQYDNKEGRASVILTLGYLLPRLDADAAQAAILECFLPVLDLVAVHMAGAYALLASMLKLANEHTRQAARQQLLGLVDPASPYLLQYAGICGWRLYLHEYPTADGHAASIRPRLLNVVQHSGGGRRSKQWRARVLAAASELLEIVNTV